MEDVHARERSGDALYLHLFRAVYATIAVHWFCPPRVNRLVFKAEIQGHRRVLDAPTRAMRRSYTAARHYDDYQVADASGKNLDGRQGIMLGKLPGLEVLGAFRDGSHPKGTYEAPAPPEEPETPKVTSIPVPTEQSEEEEAAVVPVPPSPDLPPAAITPPAAAPPPTHPDAPMPTKEPTINPAGAKPAPAQEDGGGDHRRNVPLPKKPRPVTYRIYPADRLRLDAFRTDPKQSQAENLQQVIELLENASAAIRQQEQTQGQLQEVTARAEKAEGEREQARQEAQDAAGRLQDQEGELRRLQTALEAAQAQAHAAAAVPAANNGGIPVALAVLARELLSLATGGQCQGDVQGRLIALATQALGAGGPPNQASNQAKRQDGTAGAGASKAATAAGSGQAGPKKAAQAAGDPARFGPLFEAGVSQDAQAPAKGTGDQGAKTQTPAPTPAEPGEPPAEGGAGDEGSQPEGTTAEQPAHEAQEPSGAAAVNKGPVVPKVFTRRGGASEKLDKALQAVLVHNEGQTSREKKWAVTESALARLTGCFRPAIRTFFAGKAQEIEDHNQKHHLSGGHNAARGKKGETIEREVDWRGEEGGKGEENEKKGL